MTSKGVLNVMWLAVCVCVCMYKRWGSVIIGTAPMFMDTDTDNNSSITALGASGSMVTLSV